VLEIAIPGSRILGSRDCNLVFANPECRHKCESKYPCGPTRSKSTRLRVFQWRPFTITSDF